MASPGWFSTFARQLSARFLRFRSGNLKTRTGGVKRILRRWSQFFPKQQSVMVPTFAAFRAFSLWSSTPEKEKLPENPKNLQQAVIDKADDLYNQDKVDELYSFLLEHAASENADILWRLGRAAYEQGQHSKDDKKKKTHMCEAFDYIKMAMVLDDSNFAIHKWYGILLDVVSGYEGTKSRIENSYIVKDHFKKAVDLNPSDATSMHTLGYWHFCFADLPWVQRKLASVIFATPPSATYEEALEYFLKAEHVEPNFYSTNLLMIGKCYIQLSKKEEAKEYLIRTRDYHVKNMHDQKAREEAIQLLKKLGVEDPEGTH